MLGRVKGAVHKFLTEAASMVAPLDETNEVVQPAHELSVEDLIKYPPETKGIPVIALEKILSSQYEILRLMHRDSGLQDPREEGCSKVDTPTSKEMNFDTLYRQVVINLIKYVHLLPASENHHHSDVGGLVRHSLEVALHSMRRAQQQVLPAIGHLDDEQARKPRWQYAAWICGLLHDGGKILYDMRIYDVDSGKDWNPYLNDLLAWAKENNVKRYRVTWKPEHRHKKHENLTVQILEWVLTPQAKAYLMDNSDELPIAINHALSHFGSKDGYLQTCLREADSASTEKDIRTQWHEMIGKRRYPLESAIVTAMRRLRDNWKVNQPKGHVWIIDDQVYLAWPRTIQLIVQQLQEDKVDVPVNPTKILEILEERNLVQRMDENANYSLFTASMEGVSGSEKVIRLSWPGLLFETMPVPRSVAGVLRLNNEGKSIEYKADGTIIETDSNQKTSQTTASAPIEQPPEISEQQKAVPAQVEKPADKKAETKTASKPKTPKSGGKTQGGNSTNKKQAKPKPQAKNNKANNKKTESQEGKAGGKQGFGFNKLKFVSEEEMVGGSTAPVSNPTENQKQAIESIAQEHSANNQPDSDVRHDQHMQTARDQDLTTPDFLQYYEEEQGSADLSASEALPPMEDYYAQQNEEVQQSAPPVPERAQESSEESKSVEVAPKSSDPQREKEKNQPTKPNSTGGTGIGAALRQRKAKTNKQPNQPVQPAGWLGQKKHGRNAADVFLIDLANAMANGELSIEPEGGVLLIDNKLHIDAKVALSKLDAEAGPIANKLKAEKYIVYEALKPNLLVQRKSINKKTILVIILTEDVSSRLKAELGISVSNIDYTKKTEPEVNTKPAKPENTVNSKVDSSKKVEPTPKAVPTKETDKPSNHKASDKTEFEQFLDFLTDKCAEGETKFITSSKDQSAWAIRSNEAVKAFASERLPGADNVSIMKAITGLGIGTETIDVGSGSKKYILINKELIG